MMRKFLCWFQERIKIWRKLATPVLIIDLLSDLTHKRTRAIIFISSQDIGSTCIWLLVNGAFAKNISDDPRVLFCGLF